MGAFSSRSAGNAKRRAPVREPADLLPGDLLRGVVGRGFLDVREWPGLTCANASFKAFMYQPRFLLMRGVVAYMDRNPTVARTFCRLAAEAGGVEARFILGAMAKDGGDAAAAEAHFRAALAAESEPQDAGLFIMLEPPANAFAYVRVQLAAVLRDGPSRREAVAL
eukprot:CAMPEP_0119288382 /NCGR_PEP_ID=MMETSP1329-20130426/37172_1 /TAXON_ID=114041 /ORGANISM="Genus nov. species nov., Strain RCC1024" /LENGTH=165 /DNA_ID=CAMNT_0007289163 /DNA_START=171 /DNA_END=664 /DNA_ORIENTATION=+